MMARKEPLIYETKNGHKTSLHPFNPFTNYLQINRLALFVRWHNPVNDSDAKD